MSTHADKTQQNQSQSAAHAESQKQSGETSMFGFVDNRSESVVVKGGVESFLNLMEY